MGESELCEPHERKKAKRRSVLKRLTVANAVFIVAIIVLAGISISLFGLMNDYYDAKYRAQYELVTTLADSMNTACIGITNMVDGSAQDYERLGSAVYADTRLLQAQDAANAIYVMYPKESKESNAFLSMGASIGNMYSAVAGYQSELYSAFRHNETYESNATVNALLGNATLEISTLEDLVWAGVDQSRDWLESPYSLVNGMDLAAITSASTQLMDTSRELRELIG